MKYINNAGEPAECEVWSPGPRSRSVWLTNGSCARWSDKRKRWEEVHPPLCVGQGDRMDARKAPKLAERDWQNALAS
jgi:hypothetical protein